MAADTVDTVTIPEERGIETHGIERVSPSTRTHVRIFDNFTMWLSANLVISTVALGALSTAVFQLGFWDSLAIIVVFNVLGVLPPAIFSTLGPRLGLRQMTISRFAFGMIGGSIMAIFNVAACIGWSAVNVVIGGQLVAALACGPQELSACNATVLGLTLSGTVWQALGIILIALLTTLVSIYGYRYVHYYERWSWIPMAIIFIIVATLLGTSTKHFTIAATPAFGVAEIASLISFGGAVYGFATGWSSYAADYNVNQPENTRPARVFWLTALGIGIPCILLEVLGVLLASAFGSNDVGSLLNHALSPLGGFGSLLVFLLALSIIANNIPNDYSLGLTVQVFGRAWQRVPRYVWTLIGAVIYVIISLLVARNFYETLDSFLLLIAYWLGPWSIILIVEHFVIRKGRYNVDDWNSPGKLPIGWSALVAMAVGLFGAFLGFAQTWIINGNFYPIAGVIGGLINQPYGMDVGFEIGVIFALIVYLILRPIETRRNRTRTFGQQG
ncbi:MAG TPA: cytosine permease [Ktedonobacteraceae bacterium]|nr:cytosine permease [Ktedonobacteraceae bacterium]